MGASMLRLIIGHILNLIRKTLERQLCNTGWMLSEVKNNRTQKENPKRALRNTALTSAGGNT
jgi:hypothetical protein